MSAKKSHKTNRREFLRTAGAGLAGAAGLLALDSARAANATRYRNEEFETLSSRKNDLRANGKVKSVIFINMAGGMSHVDTFDPKSNSIFNATDTSLRGVQISDRLSKTAREIHRVNLIRSVHSREGSHDRGSHLLHSGHKAMAGFTDIPSQGSVIAFAHRKDGPYFPEHVTLGAKGGLVGRGGFLGRKYGSFHVANPDRPLSDITAPGHVSEARLLRRELMLDILNKSYGSRVAAESVDAHKKMHQAALEFMNSDKLKVFELERESASNRERYGNTTIGKALLLARRLAEAEVPFIEVTIGGWDTHNNHRARTTSLLKDIDPALAALLGDLGSSGLLKQTLFVLSSEFGRTPDISANGDGRDHHPRAWTTLIGGGSLPAGRVIGATDPKGGKPVTDPVYLGAQVASVYKAAGISPEATLWTGAGRPMQLVIEGSPVSALFD